MESTIIYTNLDGLIVYTTQAVFGVATARTCVEEGDWIVILGNLPNGPYQELSRFRKEAVIGLSRKLPPVNGGGELVETVLQ